MQLINYITGRRPLRILFLILFLILIYVPISLNIYIVYNHTLEAIKKEKTQAMEQILQKTAAMFDLTTSKIQRIIDETSDNRALRKTVQDFEYYKSWQKEKLIDFYRQKFEDLKNKAFFDHVFCATKEGIIYFDDQKRVIDFNLFMSSSVYQDFQVSEQDTLWQYGTLNELFVDEREPKLHIIRKLKGVGVQSEGEDKRTVDLDEVIGYLVVTVDIQPFHSIIRNIPDTMSGDIFLYDNRYEPIVGLQGKKIPSQYLKASIQNQAIGSVKEVTLENRKYVLGVRPLTNPQWYVASMLLVEELIGPTQSALKNSFWLILFVGVLAGIWIIIEILILSKLATEKKMSEYRLYLSEEMNEKLRIYKHDFLNHLQVVQALIESDHSQQAVQYLKNVAEEGNTIIQKYEIGIPQLESAIFSSIVSAEDFGIEVKINAMKLPSDLPVKIYDLVKILTNLIKNAMHALKNAVADEKLLSIEIYSELDEYVFCISNNVPLIPREIRQKIFEKGFTTKGEDGDGLGLFIVQKLVKANRGRMELKVDEHGNHFIVRFPQYLDAVNYNYDDQR